MGEINSLIISKHAKERYAERIMNRKDRNEILRYVIENDEKIVKDISKMVEYGKNVYNGKNPRKDKLGGTTQLSIYTSNAWVVLVNPDKGEVITLFKKDLGLGEELNNTYVEKLFDKFASIQAQLEMITNEVNESNKEIKENIEANNEKIKQYREKAKILEEANAAHKIIMESNYIRIKEVEEELDDLLERIVTKS